MAYYLVGETIVNHVLSGKGGGGGGDGGGGGGQRKRSKGECYMPTFCWCLRWVYQGARKTKNRGKFHQATRIEMFWRLRSPGLPWW